MGKSIFSQTKKDPKKQQDGVWVVLNSVDELEVKLRPGNNKDARKLSNRLWREHRPALQRGSLDPEISDDITRQITAAHILVDFRGPAAVEEDGKTKLENNEKNRLRLLEIDEVFEEVAERANSQQLFRQQELEDEAGN